MSLLPTETERYTVLVDGILASSDLQTISMKQIRKKLQVLVPDTDITEKKEALQQLITSRFDIFNSAESAPIAVVNIIPTNGHNKPVSVKHEQESTPPTSSRPASSTPHKREASALDDNAVQSPKKKQKKSRDKESDDAKLAALLQAQENQGGGRATRGGGKKAAPKKKPRKKSEKKIKASDDSEVGEVGSDGEVKEKVKKGGFHKEYYLSAPLGDLVGETQLSRPQVVKKIWVYIKERNLQDPSDKRNIMCDEKLQAVFKMDKVHMFTMNKLLSKQLYPIEDEPEPVIEEKPKEEISE